MSSNPIVSRFGRVWSRLGRISYPHFPADPHSLYLHPEWLPDPLCSSPEVWRYLGLFGPLAWDRFPERDLQRNWGQAAMPYAAFAAACLFMLDRQIHSMAGLRQHLHQSPQLAWLLGFRAGAVCHNTWCGNAAPPLPTPRHFARMLRKIPNACLQFLLGSSVETLLMEMERQRLAPLEVVALDTKHILAWVRENNPKAYIHGRRYDKTQQPKGDPDCKLGCKRRHNMRLRASSKEPPQTPADNPVPAGTISVGEYYWGYASGIAAAKITGWGEFVLAELTQPFDQPDVSYFHPLMNQVEQRLGRKPRFGALDAAFDAWYIHEYFHHPELDGFAAVPFSERGGHRDRKFTPEGAPYCAADRPMVLRYTFTSRSGLIEHECQRYACPLLFPDPTGEACPIDHKNFPKNGCTSTLPASIGARLRYTLDRGSEVYKQVYSQRTATERLFSQAVHLGIERPHLRNGLAIANLNTLIYTLINLRLLERIRQ